MKIVKLIGIIEILIGGVTLAGIVAASFLGSNTKAPNVLLFVSGAAAVSTFLGIGILRLNKIAYLLLLYFSSVVFLSKVLVFMDVIRLNGALETTIPAPVKDTISLVYHAFVFGFLVRRKTRRLFSVE